MTPAHASRRTLPGTVLLSADPGGSRVLSWLVPTEVGTVGVQAACQGANWHLPAAKACDTQDHFLPGRLRIQAEIQETRRIGNPVFSPLEQPAPSTWLR